MAPAHSTISPASRAGRDDSDLARFNLDLDALQNSLRAWFATEFAILDTESGEYLSTGGLPANDNDECKLELCRQVLRGCKPAITAEEPPVAVLVLPIYDREEPRHAAVAPLVIHPSNAEEIARAAVRLGYAGDKLSQWAQRQSVWSADQLLAIAELVVSYWSARACLENKQREIDGLSAALAAAKDDYRQQADFLAGVIRALSSAIDAKDPYTCGHSDRVARIAVRIGEHLGCTPRELEVVYLAGLLHDIGKIGIDDHVLRKPGKLTEMEYENIKLHTEIGYRILKDINQLDGVLPVVRHHHEAWNGTGYPFGLGGEEIPLFARIVAVADAFDAMSSDRPYRKGMPDRKLDDILQAGAGRQWDPHVVTAFFELRDEIREIARPETDPLAAELIRMA